MADQADGGVGVHHEARWAAAMFERPSRRANSVISACVPGGVSLTGGVGNILLVVSGVLIMGIVQNAMNLLNVPTFYQYVVSGIILLAAVILDKKKQR